MSTPAGNTNSHGRVTAAPVPSELISLTLGARVTDQKHYTIDAGLSKPVGDLPNSNPERKLRASLLISYRLGD